MLFLTLFFELRLVARTRFSHAILSPSLLHTFIHRGSAHSHTQAAIGQVFLWNIYANFLLFIICLIYLLTPSHTHTVSVETEKKANKNIERSLRVDRTHTHTRIHRHSHTFNVFYQLRFGIDVRHTTATTKRRRRHERTWTQLTTRGYHNRSERAHKTNWRRRRRQQNKCSAAS